MCTECGDRQEIRRFQAVAPFREEQLVISEPTVGWSIYG